MRRGFSMLELVIALTLITLGVSLLLPAARRVDERLSVVAAREELVALIVRARGQALAHGDFTSRGWRPRLIEPGFRNGNSYTPGTMRAHGPGMFEI